MKRRLLVFVLIIAGCYGLTRLTSGCAQIGFPTGGETDTIAPSLVKASPQQEQTNFTGNRITLNFDEYIELKDLQQNLLVSPLQKTSPTITSNLRTVTIKLRDTLKPNTTYSFNFGNAIADVNEGNVLKDYTYTFSTGPYIDSLTLTGKVLLAETGKVDSTIQVLLYRHAVDTTVSSTKPDYIARLNGEGVFTFKNLPGASFRIYALKDGDGGKTYNSKTETFAFIDAAVSTIEPAAPINLLAYAEEKPTDNTPSGATPRRPAEKELKYSTSLSGNIQDILTPLQITFNGGLKTFNPGSIVVSDTNFTRLQAINSTIDSTRTKVIIDVKWTPETYYAYILPGDAFEDSAGNVLVKSDTMRFVTKSNADYGSVEIRFKNLDLASNPVLQFFQNETLKNSYPLPGVQWNNKLVIPGEYDMRILFDTNKNGNWDPGNYSEKRQPEQVISLKQKLTVKADWENELEIIL